MADDNDDGNKGRSSPFLGMFGAFGRAMSPIADRKATGDEGGQDKPQKIAAPGFGSDLKKPKPQQVVTTDTEGALTSSQSAKPTDGTGGKPEKKGFLGLWGGRRRKRKSRRTKRMARRKSRKSKRRKTRRKSRRKKRGRGWGNPNWRVGRSGTKQAGATCTRQAIGSECAPGLICQDDRCIDKKDSKFFYRTGKAMSTAGQFVPKPRSIGWHAPSFLTAVTGGKRKKTRRKKKRKSRRRKSRRRRR